MNCKALIAACVFLALGLQCSFSQLITWISFIDSATVFSSPRAIDLTGDGKLDIVVGAGKEDIAVSEGVVAFEPIAGQKLWTAPARNQIYGSAIFMDITGDQVPEAFMVGRDAQLFALNGTNGERVWEFWPDSLGSASAASYYNFYNPQFVPDQNSDGVPDLVVTNGGNAAAGPLDTMRPPGWLMLVSGLDGALIAKDTVPDFRETYHSPLVRKNASGELEILFGTGGERIRGKYYRVLLSDLRNGDINGSEILATDSLKGFICPPALVDLTNDGLYDMVVPALNGRIIALEGETGSVLWEFRRPGFEAYVSPVIGKFTGDPTPDIFVTMAEGLWPFYSSFHDYLIDGATGLLVREDSTPFFQLAQPNVLDWDNDGVDEVLLVRNFDSGVMTLDYNTSFRIRDFNHNTEIQFGGLRQGITIFSTPLLVDLDLDGLLEWVVAWHPVQGSWNAFDGAHIGRVNVGFNRPDRPWDSYLGTYWDGTYRTNLPISIQSETSAFGVRAYPNPAGDRIAFEIPAHLLFEHVIILDLNGRQCKTSFTPEIDISDLPAGLYLYRVSAGGKDAVGKLLKGK